MPLNEFNTVVLILGSKVGSPLKTSLVVNRATYYIINNFFFILQSKHS